MCSIAGVVNFKIVFNQRIHRNIICKMNSVLTHRGPDQNGMVFGAHFAFAHNRLAVIDVERGIQPMTIRHQGYDYAMVYNGELYNTDELRLELQKAGYTFKTHSDTEVLLTSYIEWSEDCLSKLNGIFAFAIYDEKLNRVIFARDRFGVKPLFYSIKNESFIFASEIKGILAHPDISPILDKESFLQLFCLSPSRIPTSGIFKGIDELPSGSFGVIDENGFVIKTYWELSAKEHTDSCNDTIEKTRYLLLDSIKRQLVSDVPLCTLLSGGLDSSIISSVASKEYISQGKILSTYSFEHEGNHKYFTASKFQPESDEYYASLASEYIGSDHSILTITAQQSASMLTQATDFRDLPGMGDIDSSLMWYCQQIKEHHTVSLSGECADEIFGGYPWFYREDMVNSNTFPWIHDVSARTRLFKKGVVTEVEAKEFLAYNYENSVKACPTLPGEAADEAKKRLICFLNIKWFMYQLLERKDRMSMACGLEIRVPFADHRLAEYVFNVPWSIKLENGVEKSLLRKAAQGILPDNILYRKKSPYPKTHNPEYFNIVKGILDERLSHKSSPLSSILDKNILEETLNGNNITWFGQLMSAPQLVAYLIQLDYFLYKFGVQL